MDPNGSSHFGEFKGKGLHLSRPFKFKETAETEEIPYTRFDLQEFFDPDMEAPTAAAKLQKSSVDVKVTSHSQGT